MKCSRCVVNATIKQGHQWLCDKHYRFGQMRSRAKTSGKLVPSHEELHRMAPEDMNCRCCKRRMNWRQRDGASTTATLQHNRDGSMEIICLSCNVRHASMNGDSFYKLADDRKTCPDCKRTLPLTSFCADKSGRWKNRKSTCRTCSSTRHAAWVGNNREECNAKRRKYYHARKASGNPIPR